MTFPPRRVLRRISLLSLAAVAFACASCQRALTPEEKQTRAELRQALREQSFAQAEELAQRVVESAPRENGAWQRLLHAQLGLRDFASAKQSLARWRAAVRQPSAKLAEFTGDIAAEEGDPALALQSWQKSLTEHPWNTRLLRKVAQLHRAQHAWREEEAALTSLLHLEENAADRMVRAFCRRRLHRWDEAVDDSRRAQELAPDDPDVRRGAKLFQRLSKFLAEMRELDRRLASTPADDQLLADRALLFLRADDPELALADSEAAAKSATWAVRPRLFQAIALQQLGRAANAGKLGVDAGLRLDNLSAEFLQTISRLDSDISVERANAELYVSRAWQLNDIGQPTLAHEDSETALRFDPNSAGAHAEGAYALMKLGRAEEALARIQRATALDPNFSTAWHYRGELEMVHGDFVGAIESLTRALAINQTPAALQKREECYRQVGLFTKAEEDHRAYETLNTQM